MSEQLRKAISEWANQVESELMKSRAERILKYGMSVESVKFNTDGTVEMTILTEEDLYKMDKDHE